MEHRQRVKRCINHESTDRIPVDLWLDSNDPGVLQKLLEYTGKQTYVELMEMLDIDIYRPKTPVNREYLDPNNEVARYFVPTRDLRLMTFSSEFKRPLDGAGDIKDIEKVKWPEPVIFDYAGLVPICRSHRDRFLWIQPGTWSPIFCRMADLMGLEKTLIEMVTNQKLIEGIVEKLLEFYMQTFKYTIEASLEYIDAFSFGDDYASQQNMIFDRSLWVKYFKDPVKKLCDLIRSYDVPVAFHSCGAIYSIIPDLIDCGVQILFPLQPNARGMDFVTLKREFGADLAFYGGIDTQQVLPFGSTRDVKNEVRKVSGILGRGGGYILSGSHSLLKDVPVENILAMYDEIGVLNIAK